MKRDFDCARGPIAHKNSAHAMEQRDRVDSRRFQSIQFRFDEKALEVNIF